MNCPRAPKSPHGFAACFASQRPAWGCCLCHGSYFEKWGSAVGMEGSGGTEMKGKSAEIIGSCFLQESGKGVPARGGMSLRCWGVPQAPRCSHGGVLDPLWAGGDEELCSPLPPPGLQDITPPGFAFINCPLRFCHPCADERKMLRCLCAHVSIAAGWPGFLFGVYHFLKCFGLFFFPLSYLSGCHILASNPWVLGSQSLSCSIPAGDQWGEAQPPGQSCLLGDAGHAYLDWQQEILFISPKPPLHCCVLRELQPCTVVLKGSS